jgi:hypothetical protein
MDAADKSLLCHGLTPKLKLKSLLRRYPDWVPLPLWLLEDGLA